MVALLLLLWLLSRSSVAAFQGSLQELYIEEINRFNETNTLGKELDQIVRVSIELIERRTSTQSELLHHLKAARNAATAGELLSEATAALSQLTPSAASDPILVVLARRLILAIAALRILGTGLDPTDNSTEAGLSKVTSELYGLHVDAAVRKGLVDHLHISKSGGTSFSKAARLNRCAMPGGIGQPLYLGDLPHWINRTAFYGMTGGVHITWSIYGRVQRTGEVQGCGDRLARIRQQGFHYVSNEYTLFGGLDGSSRTHVCPLGVNVVTFRDPEARLSSHLHFLLAHIKRVGARHGAVGDLFRSTFCRGNRSVWEEVAPAVVDNYMVRSFLGEKGFHSPVGAVGSAALAVAVRQLLQYDLVLDLGAGDEAAATIMRQGLGWNVTLAEVHQRSMDRVSSWLHYDKEECAVGQLLREVGPRQDPDRQLYRLGRVLSFLDRCLLAMAARLGLQPSTAAAGRQSSEPDVPPRGCGLVGLASPAEAQTSGNGASSDLGGSAKDSPPGSDSDAAAGSSDDATGASGA